MNFFDMCLKIIWLMLMIWIVIGMFACIFG